MSTLILRTTIRPEMKKWALLKGVLLTTGFLGCIWICELILPLLGFESVATWIGWTLRTAAMGAGFFPFQKLSQQNRHPELLQIDEKEIAFYQADTVLFTLPWNMVQSFSYLDRGSSYGFTFMLKNPYPDDLALLLEQLASTSPPTPSPSPYNLPSFLIEKSRREHGVDLFLPNFSASSFQMLKQWHLENASSSY